MTNKDFIPEQPKGFSPVTDEAHTAELRYTVPVKLEPLLPEGLPRLMRKKTRKTLSSAIAAERRVRAKSSTEDLMTIRRQQELMRDAEVDFVTGLPNRKAFERDLNARIARQQHGSRSRLGLFIADGDRVKDINDTLGHPVGDRYIRKIGEGLKASIRPGDEVYRIGGDEFAIVMEGMVGPEEEIVPMVSTRAKHYVGEALAPFGNMAGSVSIGGKFFEPHMYPSDLFNAADEAMFVDKRTRGTGRES